MLYIGSAFFSVGYFVLTISYGLLSLPLWLLPPKFRHAVIISWTHAVIFWARICCGIKYKIYGLENFRSLGKPAVVLAKHQCSWETFFLQGLFWPASTILKKELLNMPFFGWGLRALRPIAIDRDNPREALRQVKAQGKERLNAGMNLIIFPEGTRVAVGERGKYARSGADIAIDAGVPIIPVAHNAGRYWRNKEFIKLPGTITVVIGRPILMEEKNSKVLTESVETWVEQACHLIEQQDDDALMALVAKTSESITQEA